MKVVHLSTHDLTGGAARAGYRLHAGLRRLNVDSTMLVFGRASEDPTVLRFEPGTAPHRRLARAIRRRRIAADGKRYLATRPAGLEQFSDDRTEYGGEVVDQLPPCDVLHLHWIAGWVDLQKTLSRLPRSQPIVWTLHDMNAFTGGCHYTGGCVRFEARCGACPQLGSTEEADLSRDVWTRKDDVFGALRHDLVRIVADSEWLAREARRSTLLGRFDVRTIHYGLDTEVFAPRDRLASRKVLGIPEDARVLLFVADAIDNERKGFVHLAEALRRLERLPGLFLVSIGRGAPPAPVGVPQLHLERVTSDRFLSIVYSAADVFALPSIEEAYGQTALEAIACGTPAVGFDSGGIPDVIRPGETGLLAKTGDGAELAERIETLLGDGGARARMAERGRRMVEAEHSLEAQARRYEEIYGDLMRARDAGGIR